MNRFCIAAILLAHCGAAVGGDLGAIVEECDGCHGVDGVSQWTDMPTIAGTSVLVHADALYVYQEDARPCRESEFRIGDTDRPKTDMCKVAKALTEEQIEAIAEYYADKPFVAARQDYDEALAARGKVVHDEACEKCHTDNGTNVDDDAGLLKGQWMGYMRQTLADYNSGERDQPKKMKDKLDPLSAEDVEALVHFYGKPD
ncbi:MAG: cytochrome c-553 [Pseudomonadota bacterium]